jgi:putative oxidoreductase
LILAGDDMAESIAVRRKSTVAVSWLFRVLVGLTFLAAGGAKLIAEPGMVAMFAAIGVGQWFRMFTGVLEIAAAIGLFIPGVTVYAALLLMVVMVGAIIAHVAILGGSPFPAIALLLLSGGIAWLTRAGADASRN